MEVLFKTPHGSRLYGLHNDDSDYDWYTVVSENPTRRKRYARQTIVDEVDSFVVDIGTWLQMVSDGVPQACEALMSRTPVVDKITELRESYVLPPSISERYLRTIKSFALSDTFKSKRHATRLAFNLHDALHSGRFDPTMSERDVSFANTMAQMSAERVYEFVTEYALYI